MPRESISSKWVIYLYKYFFFPIFVGFFAAGLFIGVNDPEASTQSYVVLFGIVGPLLFLSFYWFFSTKFIYIDEIGIYFKEKVVKWAQINKIKFINMSPPLVFFRYNINGKKGSVRTILPFTQFSSKKSMILSLKEKYG